MPIQTNTQNTAHTPGPWHRYGDGSGIAGPDGQPIAVVAREGATWDANAQLITAAPDLLTAARAAYRLLRMGRDASHVDVGTLLADAIGKADLLLQP